MESWQSGRMQRFRKPSIFTDPGVRIPRFPQKRKSYDFLFSYISVLLLRILVLLFCKLYPATIDSQKATEIEGFGGCLRAIGLHKAVINVFADCFDVDWWREVVVIEAFDSHFLALGTYI